MNRRFFAYLCAICFPLASCVVTDEIEFEEAINHPPQLETVSPQNDTIQKVCPEEIAITVAVWDADEEDAETYSAQLYITLENGNNPTPKWCTTSKIEITEVSSGETESGAYISDTGAHVSVTCDIDKLVFDNQEENDLVLAKVVVYDRKVSVGDILPEDTKTVEVVWVFQVLPQEAC